MRQLTHRLQQKQKQARKPGISFKGIVKGNDIRTRQGVRSEAGVYFTDLINYGLDSLN